MEPIKKCNFSSLTLDGLRLPVHLGCLPEERKEAQWVRFYVEVRFPSLPLGCISDDLKETVCYAEISEILKQVCHSQEYHLIEKMGWEAYRLIKSRLTSDILLSVRILKEKPPVENLTEGSSFRLGDWN